jgi:hypothetical protein
MELLLSMEFSPPSLSRRLASASGALFVQGVFLLLLLYATPKFLPSTKFERETTLILPRLQKAHPLPIKIAPRMAAPPLEKRPNPGISAPITRPSTSFVPIIPPSAIQGFGQELNNCTPEKYATLPED